MNSYRHHRRRLTGNVLFSVSPIIWIVLCNYVSTNNYKSNTLIGVGSLISDLTPSQSSYLLPNDVTSYPIHAIQSSPFLQFTLF